MEQREELYRGLWKMTKLGELLRAKGERSQSGTIRCVAEGISVPPTFPGSHHSHTSHQLESCYKHLPEAFSLLEVEWLSANSAWELEDVYPASLWPEKWHNWICIWELPRQWDNGFQAIFQRSVEINIVVHCSHWFMNAPCKSFLLISYPHLPTKCILESSVTQRFFP